MAVHHILRDGILLVTIDAPPVNALSRLERQGLIDAIAVAERSDAIAVVIRGANGSFVAGADVREFGSPPQPPHLPDVVYVNGYGFPRHRGGPMYHAEQIGIERVRARMNALSAGRFGHWWTPAPIFADDLQGLG